MRRILAVSLSVVVFAIAARSEATARYALVVGHNLGAHGEAPLSYAEDDAVRFFEVLETIGGVTGGNLILLTSPTIAEVRAAFEALEMRASSAPEGVLIFYFAGHGDESNLHLGDHLLTRAEVKARMTAHPSRTKLAFIDACQTPAVTQHRGVRAGPSFDIAIEGSDTPRGVVFISSSAKGQPALESKHLEGALFTHHLISGMRGAADADRDGRITLSEAYAHARRLTVLDSATVSDIVQTPSFEMELFGADELVLTETGRARARLLLPRGAGSRYVVFQKSSARLLAEVEGSDEAHRVVAVPAGRLLVARRSSDRSAVAEVDAPFGGERILASTDFVPQSTDVIIRRGGLLELRPHLVSLSARGELEFIDAGLIGRAGPRVRYERHHAPFVGGLSGEAVFASYRSETHETSEQAIALSGDLGWRRRLTALALSAGLGPHARLVFQQRHRRDAERLDDAGLSSRVDRENLALGFGGRIGAAVALPLTVRLELGLGLDATVLGQRVTTNNGTSVHAITSCGVWLGLGFRHSRVKH